MKTTLPYPWLRRAWKEVLSLAIPALAVLAAKSSLAEINFVPSGSMEPSILVGDAVWVNHLAYGLRVPFTTVPLAHWADPVRGDIVICYEPKTGIRLVKRVVGLPGDTIEQRNDILFVNGQQASYARAASDAGAELPQAERGQSIVAREQLGLADHLVMALPRRAALRTFGPTVVPAGSYFLMGDNRDNSNDSRFFGCVARREIVGRAVAVVASADPQHYLRPRFGRFFTHLE